MQKVLEKGVRFISRKAPTFANKVSPSRLFVSKVTTSDTWLFTVLDTDNVPRVVVHTLHDHLNHVKQESLFP